MLKSEGFFTAMQSSPTAGGGLLVGKKEELLRTDVPFDMIRSKLE